MRNLKRALSLALASVMVLGLMVVGSGASYADVTSEENQEAIEVLQAVGVMVGDDEGNFNPDKNVTRNEMAVVMSNLLDLKVEDFNAADIPFTDVPSWAVAYVAACYADGITSGTSATTYGGSNTVTAAQAALMMMKALGYFQYQGDFEQDWTLATIKKGSEIGIFDGITVDRTSPLTRNDVAQMALNALKSNMVTFTGEVGIEIPTAGGQSIVVGYKAEYTPRTSANRQYDSIDTGTTNIAANDQFYVQLGEELYGGDLKLRADTDVFGRPARYWEYDGKEIGTYADESQMIAEFTTAVTGDEMYDVLTRNTVVNYGMDIVLDGEYEDSDAFTKNDINRRNDADLDGTGRGVLTQVYVDSTNETVSISVIHTYAAEVARVRDDGDEAYITLNDLTGGPANSSDRYETDLFEEDEIVLYTFAENAIQSVVAADELTGEVTRVKETDSFVVGGTTYKYTFGMTDTEKLTTGNVDNDVVAYLDAYGYVIYIDDSAISYDYAFVLDVGITDGRYTTSPEFGATLLLTDGTVVEADLDVPSSVYGSTPSSYLDEVSDEYKDKIISYTVDDEEYTLKPLTNKASAAHDSDLDINNDRSAMKIGSSTTNVYANSNTVFLLDDGDDNYTVYTGVANVPDISGTSTSTAVYYSIGSSTVARVVYVKNADVEGEGSVVFIEADKGAKAIKDSEGNYYELNAVVDGEITTILMKTGTDAAKALVEGTDGNGAGVTNGMVAYKSLVYNSDGLVTDVRNNGLDTDNYTGTREYERNDDTVGLGYASTKYYTYSDDVVVVYYDGDDLRTARITSVGDDEDDSVIAVFDDGQIIGLCITENDGEKKPEVTGYEVVGFENTPMEVTADTTGITLKYAKVLDSNGQDYAYGKATLTAVIKLREGGEWTELPSVSEEVTASSDPAKDHVVANDTGVKLESSMLRDGDWISVTLTLSNKEMGTITFVENEQFRISAPAEGGAGA